MRERDVQRAILDWLAAKGILAFRMQTGRLRNPAGVPVAFGTPGMADVLAFPSSQAWRRAHDEAVPIWIECKAPKGRQSDLQKSFQAQVESHGHHYLLARSLDDVIEAVGG